MVIGSRRSRQFRRTAGFCVVSIRLAQDQSQQVVTLAWQDVVVGLTSFKGRGIGFISWFFLTTLCQFYLIVSAWRDSHGHLEGSSIIVGTVDVLLVDTLERRVSTDANLIVIWLNSMNKKVNSGSDLYKDICFSWHSLIKLTNSLTHADLEPNFKAVNET